MPKNKIEARRNKIENTKCVNCRRIFYGRRGARYCSKNCRDQYYGVIPKAEEGEGINILITGGTGSFGRKAVEYLLTQSWVRKVVVFSRDECKQWEMQKTLNHSNVRYFIGSIRDKERLQRAFHSIDWVIHAAALKHVPAMEYNPIEAINTNILGTQNVINAAIDQGVKKVILLSTDKAVNPVNLYGASKLCAEKLMVASNVYTSGEDKCRFSAVRYGNVISSRGSVYQIFEEQKKTGVLTVTDERMTRFWISLDNTVKFVISCMHSMLGGEIFIPKLPSKKIIDIAGEVCSECKIRFTGIRPGEKLHEVLISKDEAVHVKEYDNYYVIDKDYINLSCKDFEYSSCR